MSIAMKNVSFAYSKRPFLRNCSVEFPRGQLCSVIGPNGSGKTTLLKLICGHLLPQDGKILLENKPLGDYGRKELAKKLAWMPQTRSIPEMTVREYVEHGRYPYLPFSQKLSQADNGAVKDALIKTNTVGYESRNLRELSGGERQRVYLALLLVQDTEYALLDEPTTFLDPLTQFGVMDVMRKMADEGRCVLAVLHDLSLAMQFSDRIIVMDHGEIAADGTPQELGRSSAVWEKTFGLCCDEVRIRNQTKYIFEPTAQ